MAILLLVGTPGAGKSYAAVALGLLPALEMGRPVRTNIPLQMEEIRRDYPIADVQAIDPQDEMVWSTIPGGALVIVDEVGTLWPAGQRADQAPQGVMRWFAMHRHHVGKVGDAALACEVVILSQGSTDFARWLRTRVDSTYILEKLDKVGLERQYRCHVYAGWQDQDRPLKKRFVQSLSGVYESRVYRYYRSHTASDQSVSGLSVRELRTDKRSIWSNWSVRIGLVGMLATPFAVYAAYNSLRNVGGAPAEDSAAVAAKPAEPRKAELPKPRPVLPDSDWAISGYMAVGSRRTITIWHPEHGQRTIRGAECEGTGPAMVCHWQGKTLRREGVKLADKTSPSGAGLF